MKNSEARLAELFSLAQNKAAHGSLARRLSPTVVPARAERDISAFTETLKKADSENNFNRDILHYSYGL